MTDADAIERRLSAVERAVSGGVDDLGDVGAAAERDRRTAAIEDRLDDLEDAVTELDAATQALRGYVGNVRSVNRDVERRAEAALAAVDRLEGEIGANGRDRDRSGTDHDREAATEGSTGRAKGGNIAVDELATGPEMPIPGASDGSGVGVRSGTGDGVAADGTAREDEPATDADDGGVFDRVRDAL